MTALMLSKAIADYTMTHDLSVDEAIDFGKVQARLIARSAFEIDRVSPAMRYGEYEGHDSASLARAAD
jgi:hypothetical protein